MASRNDPMKAAAPSGPCSSRRRRTSAEPDHHAVGHLAHLRRLIRRRHAHADADRHVRAAPDPLDDLGDVRSEVDPLPRHAHAGDGVDETTRPGADALHPVGRRRRRHQQDGVDARRVGLGGPGADLLDREVGDDAPGDAGGGHGAGHALVAGPKDQVVIGHDRDRHRGLRPRNAVEDLVGHRAPPERTQPPPPESPARPSWGPRRGCRPPPRRPPPRSPRPATASSHPSCPP